MPKQIKRSSRLQSKTRKSGAPKRPSANPGKKAPVRNLSKTPASSRWGSKKKGTTVAEAEKKKGRKSVSPSKPRTSSNPASSTTKSRSSSKTSKFGVGSSKTVQHKGRKMANVTKEQLQKSGYKSLTAYMNAWNKQGKRPTKKK